jgi:hypothetical protein
VRNNLWLLIFAEGSSWNKKAPELVRALAVATLLELQIVHARDDANVRLKTLFRAGCLLMSKIMHVKQLIVSIDGSRIHRRARNRPVLSTC